MIAAAKGDEDTDLTDIVLQAIGLLLCGLALLLPLYYSQWFSDSSDTFSAAQVLSPTVQEDSLAPTPAHFEILHSAHQRGLMRYNGYVYLLRPGDVLPDGARVSEFQKQDGRWIVVAL
jgi:hypothetical protein